MKEEQQDNLKLAKEKQRQISLVDFSFSRMSNFKLVQTNPATQNIQRIKYDYNDYQRIGAQYTNWLKTKRH